MSTVGVPQQGGLSKAVSRYKAVKIAWRDCRIALTTRTEYGGFSRQGSHIAPAHHDLTGGGGGTHLCMAVVVTIDPRIPTMPERSTSGFHQPGRQCLHQGRSAVMCSASRMKGELNLSKNRLEDGLRLLSCLWMTAPMSNTLFPGVVTPEGVTM